MTEKTKKVGLIGFPVEHSLSPAMHNAAFTELGMHEWHYDLLSTPKEELELRIKSLGEAGYIGANVTLPHKTAALSYVDRVMMAARGVGAINTIVLHEGKLEGHNTDSVGFIMDLQAHGVAIHRKRALVLGAGGSAHAVVLGLANAGANVTVMARREDSAWQLREKVRRGVSFSLRIEVQPLTALAKVATQVDLIVNTTPAGMFPQIEESPWPAGVPIPSHVFVYDLIYRPRETLFMRQAQEAGAKAIGGLGMLVYQGAAAFELWTGQVAPVEVMKRAVETQLER